VRETHPLSDAEIAAFVQSACATLDTAGRRVLCIVPDQTRSMPLPQVFRALCTALLPSARQLDFLVALGTHPPLDDVAMFRLFGLDAKERDEVYAGAGLHNHAWQEPAALATIGRLEAREIAELSGGRLHEAVTVQINRRIIEADLVIIAGPVFPHEVVGFSGGNKYFFPGVAGAEILHLFHWLGALITNYAINGSMHTPVRAVIDRAAALIPVEKRCFCFNVLGKSTHGIFFGTPEEAWLPAARLSARTHIHYTGREYRSVLAMAPPMYDELWVAGKCMYKLEPVVADGGELIIYGPHISRISETHGALIRRIGYHVRDYFLAQMDKFHDIPGGILAHSTHVRGAGTFRDGIERPRIQVTLATSIPEEECRAVNLGYRDPAAIDPALWENREAEDRLLVRNAGEVLYRVRAQDVAA
jgi:nickel-dependent lactate racemase